MQKSSGGLLKINMLFAVASSLLLVIPMMRAPFLGSTYTLVMALTIGGWLATAIIIDVKWLVKPRPTLIKVGIVLFVYFFLTFFGLGNIKDNIITISTVWYFYLIYCFYSYNDFNKQFAGIGLLCGGVYFFTVCTTLYALQTKQYLVRELGTVNIAERLDYLRSNIGGVEFAYGGGLFAAILIVIITNNELKKKSHRIIAIIMLVICVLFALSASSGNVILCIIIMFLYIPFQRMNNKAKIALAALAFVIFVFSLSIFPPILRDIGTNLDNQYISKKLVDIANSIEYGSTTGDVAARTDRYWMSIETFFGTGLLGRGPYYPPIANDYGIDGHSQLLSDMARYGLLFLIVILSFLKSYYKELAEKWRKFHLKSTPQLVFLIFLIMYTLNPVMQMLGVAIVFLLIYPSVPYIINRLNSKA